MPNSTKTHAGHIAHTLLFHQNQTYCPSQSELFSVQVRFEPNGPWHKVTSLMLSKTPTAPLNRDLLVEVCTLTKEPQLLSKSMGYRTTFQFHHSTARHPFFDPLTLRVPELDSLWHSFSNVTAQNSIHPLFDDHCLSVPQSQALIQVLSPYLTPDDLQHWAMELSVRFYPEWPTHANVASTVEPPRYNLGISIFYAPFGPETPSGPESRISYKLSFPATTPYFHNHLLFAQLTSKLPKEWALVKASIKPSTNTVCIDPAGPNSPTKNPYDFLLDDSFALLLTHAKTPLHTDVPYSPTSDSLLYLCDLLQNPRITSAQPLKTQIPALLQQLHTLQHEYLLNTISC